MKINKKKLSIEDHQVMVHFLEIFWAFRLETEDVHDLLSLLRQSLFMRALEVGNPLAPSVPQIDSLEDVLNEITFNSKHLKLFPR